MTAKQIDTNGWTEIKGNPISKVGVFEYLGSQISSELIPDKVYNVYRPEEELANQDCLNSFKLVPWTDDHAMLGAEDEGLLPAEQKGIHGVIGEEVYYEDGYLKANLKIFSQKLSQLIEDGKKELSIGYRCVYDIISGTYNGKVYDAIQRKIRGNHVALVNEGRAGPDVAVLDHFKFALDTKRLITMPETNITLEALDAKLSLLTDAVSGLKKAFDEAKPDMLVTKAEVEDADEDKDEDEDKKKTAEDEDEEKDDDKKKDGMDMRIEKLAQQVQHLRETNPKHLFQEISKRNALAEKLSQHVGVFDHSEMTLDEVAQYGIKKLGLSCEKGQEAPILTGFFAGKKLNVEVVGQDSNIVACAEVDAFINGGE